MIAIKNMKIPKSCAECQFGCIVYNNNRKCKISESCYSVILTSEERPTDCPLVEIVTCKDCEYCRFELVEGIPYYWCDKDNCATSENFYCANAERRE